ncbi:hypothetical protein BPO_1982 [Bergeyella porcorum]|uniref:Uncharacterized protein n=1 Tax=Bergeyella porcorum TaxID=1735111 RepID=A0AAU0F1L2_9FLAO
MENGEQLDFREEETEAIALGIIPTLVNLKSKYSNVNFYLKKIYYNALN